MRLALTHCPDDLIRRLASFLPTEEVALGILPPRAPSGPKSDGASWDAILTTAGAGTDAEHIRWLRRAYRSVPILAVTPNHDPDSVIRALDAGAAAVLQQPVDKEELQLRLRALVPAPEAHGPFRWGGVRLNRLRHAVEGPGGSVGLTRREYQILQHLMLRAEKVVSRAELGRAVWWDQEAPPSSNLLDVHVSQLRRKLREAGVEPLIRTVKRVGFVFGTVEGESPAS